MHHLPSLEHYIQNFVTRLDVERRLSLKNRLIMIMIMIIIIIITIIIIIIIITLFKCLMYLALLC